MLKKYIRAVQKQAWRLKEKTYGKAYRWFAGTGGRLLG
ncbi:hypothetical protein DCCM_4796 [Desulfocucumis palustris]|uniref:Uncharacterized protein n=1 Tax=Desulfocucumis palustris TaxID=1898651 RepID=A0A2L2XH29_9FIRM|nr:hypothetical protein DCCM_4796 [Desulfocucumis palustris]